MKRHIKCNLLENAIDYLLLAAELVALDNERQTKHAIAILGDGIELLLKARLEKEGWYLIFKDLDKATRDKYESGDFESASYKQLIDRIENLCNIAVASSSVDILNRLRNERNRARHFAVNIEYDAAVAMIAKTFSFAIDFIAEQFADSIGSHEDVIQELRRYLGQFSQFVEVRMKVVKSQIDTSHPSFVIKCPKCLQLSLVSDGKTVNCHFCTFTCDSSCATDEWMDAFGPSRLRDWLVEQPLSICPNCGDETCFFAEDSLSEKSTAVCLVCGEAGDYRHCPRCDTLYDGTDEDPMCPECWQDICHRND